MAERLGGVVRVGMRAEPQPDDAPIMRADGGVGLARAALALTWNSPDDQPQELELTIAPRFMERSTFQATLPRSMLPFRWGISQSIGGVAMEEGGGFAPMAPLTARGVRVQLAATALSVEVGYLPFNDLNAHTGDAWIDFLVTLCPIQSGGSSLIHHTMHLTTLDEWYVGDARPAFFELPRFSREWKARLDGGLASLPISDPEGIEIAVFAPSLDLVEVVSLASLEEWQTMSPDAWAIGFQSGTFPPPLTLSFR